MARLPRNLHLVTTSRSTDNAIRRKHATGHVESAAPATHNDIGGVHSAACATKHATHLLNMLQKYCACHTKRLLTRHETCWTVSKCHGCHAKWRYATLENSKSNPLCRTSYRHGHTDLTRTLANGCERLRTVANVNATSGEHSSTPTPPEWNGNPCYAFGKKGHLCSSWSHKDPKGPFLEETLDARGSSYNGYPVRAQGTRECEGRIIGLL